MAVKVLITRRFKKEKIREVFSVLSQIRTQALKQRGYITGETLFGHDDPQKLVVISTWESADDWLKWKDDPVRKKNEAELQQFLVDQPQYEIFTFGAYPYQGGAG